MASAQATELIEASKEGDAEKVKQLLGKGASLDVQDDYGCTYYIFFSSFPRGHTNEDYSMHESVRTASIALIEDCECIGGQI